MDPLSTLHPGDLVIRTIGERKALYRVAWVRAGNIALHGSRLHWHTAGGLCVSLGNHSDSIEIFDEEVWLAYVRQLAHRAMCDDLSLTDYYSLDPATVRKLHALLPHDDR
jgi:hypothetical protein